MMVIIDSYNLFFNFYLTVIKINYQHHYPWDELWRNMGGGEVELSVISR